VHVYGASAPRLPARAACASAGWTPTPSCSAASRSACARRRARRARPAAASRRTC
jgi:hypothetical protein